MLTKSAIDLVKEAKQQIDHLTPMQVNEALKKRSAILIDLRESEELKENGRIPGAIHAPRGMIEFYADPSQPYYRPEFNEHNRIILHCASGNRSALAAVSLMEMGYRNVAHMEGGFKAWKEAGLPITN